MPYVLNVQLTTIAFMFPYVESSTFIGCLFIFLSLSFFLSVCVYEWCLSLFMSSLCDSIMSISRCVFFYLSIVHCLSISTCVFFYLSIVCWQSISFLWWLLQNLSLSLSLSLSVGHDSSFSNCKEIGNLSPQGKAIKVSRPPHYYFSAIFNQSEWDMSIISIPLSLPLSLALSLGDVIKDLIFWEGNESLKLMKVQNIILR